MRPRTLELARGALASIEANRRRIDDLNVYPVPDGDTGTNLTLTVRAIVEALESSTGDDREALAREISRAALMGARGNSGVILSQIVRGAAESLGRSGDLAAALRSASDAAYRAVKKPVEGTMLTAIRELAEEAERGGDLEAILARGDDCVRRTQELLPVLKEAGVVDAGAAGLVEILRGIAAALSGEPLPEAPTADASHINLDALHAELSEFRYCTVFVVEGERLDADRLEAEFDPLGDSLLVVGDETALKVHVHTDDPGRALSLGVARGTIAGVEIANMHVQTVQREERILHAVPDPANATCAVVAVASGRGNRALFESFGASVVDGGQTMNPSTAEILAAIEAAGSEEVVVLPNDENVLMAAEHAAAQSSRPVAVVPTASLQAGLGAVVAFDPSSAAEDNRKTMERAAEGVAAGAVTIASRDVVAEGLAIRKGMWLGLTGGKPFAGGETFDEVARLVVAELLGEPRDLLTVLTGEGAEPVEAIAMWVAETFPAVEVEIHDGGQPNYALLLAAE